MTEMKGMTGMRIGLKDFREFHQLADWKTYVATYMANTLQEDADNEIRILTNQGETIAVWQKHGYGFIEECRSPERLSNMLG